MLNEGKILLLLLINFLARCQIHSRHSAEPSDCGISMMYFNIHLWFLDKADFAQLSWDNMSKKQRLKASSIMTIYMLGFVFGGVAVRIINGIALSLNAFITLGYGEISAKGIARYLAVVEGCIGWFLLSIFSVSLIAQMMQ